MVHYGVSCRDGYTTVLCSDIDTSDRDPGPFEVFDGALAVKTARGQ
jgi:hypothetical protein